MQFPGNVQSSILSVVRVVGVDRQPGLSIQSLLSSEEAIMSEVNSRCFVRPDYWDTSSNLRPQQTIHYLHTLGTLHVTRYPLIFV